MDYQLPCCHTRLENAKHGRSPSTPTVVEAAIHEAKCVYEVPHLSNMPALLWHFYLVPLSRTGYERDQII